MKSNTQATRPKNQFGRLLKIERIKKDICLTGLAKELGIKEVPTGLLIFAWKLMAWLATVAPLVEGLPAPAVNSRDDNCAFVIAGKITISKAASTLFSRSKVVFIVFRFGYMLLAVLLLNFTTITMKPT